MFEKEPKIISTPEQELEHFKKTVGEQAENISSPEKLKENLRSYHSSQTNANNFESSYSIKEEEIGKIVLDLEPEEHDDQVQYIFDLAKTRGIKNAMSVISRMNNPHLEDDFCRFMIEYLREGNTLPSLKEKSSLSRDWHIILYEVNLPRADEEKGKMELSDIISAMEQFYGVMYSIGKDEKIGPRHFSIEVAIPNFQEEYSFFVSVPSDRSERFEKHILSLFPNAKLTAKKDDYNIFNENGYAVGSVAESRGNPVFSLKTYEEFDHDPLNVLLNSFSKIDRDGEGAAVQFVFSIDGANKKHTQFKKALEKIKKGEPLKEAIKAPSIFGYLVKGLSAVVAPKKKDDKMNGAAENNQFIEAIEKKINTNLYMTNIRILASSHTEREAVDILSDIESVFHQFDNPTSGHALKFSRQKKGRLKKLFSDFSYRRFASGTAIPLNFKELTSMFHFETSKIVSAPQLKKSKSAEAPAPAQISAQGILLGINTYQGMEKKIFMAPEDRLRHLYAIGQTGTGKSSLLKNMIVQDIQNGDGVCFIDPHGSDIQDILSLVPKERYNDVIYFDPSHTARPMGLNMLEYNPEYPEQKTFVVNELFSIFQKLYGAVPESMGPMFEQYFRNATMLVIEDPESGSTLLDVSRVLADAKYRALKLSKCKNPVVVQFWEEVAQKAGGEASLANIVPYITSKFDVFLANDVMRPIVAQEHSAFNFREIMDNKKILLVNLSKGRLGDINANLIGLIVVGKILMSALSRADSYGKDMPPFYLYIDEFQNVTTNSVSVILSEARKYKLSLTIAHQFIAQLEEDIRDSVFGNVGSIVSFRVGSDDSEYLEKQFAPVFKMNDLMNVDNYNAFVRVLSGGRPVTPFSIKLTKPEEGSKDQVPKLKELSYLTYGRDRADVESEIMNKYSRI